MIFFQQNLLYLRTKRKMTLAVMANEVGFSASHWCNYEQGISFPKFLDLIKIARYFELTETYLIHTDLRIDEYAVKNTPDKQNNSLVETIELQNKLIKLQEDKIDTLQKEIIKYKKI